MKSKKVTTLAETQRRRWYDDACAAAHALDLLGERWALLVMRELIFGPKRFGELRADLPGISANVLTQRLEGLEEAGVVLRRRLPPPANAQVYELTEWGRESEPIFMVLGRWAARSPFHDPTLAFSAASLLLSLKTMFDPALAAGMTARIGLRTGRDTATLVIAGGRIAIGMGLERPDVVITGKPPAIAGVIYGGQPIAAMEAAGVLSVEGDRAVLERFVTLFPLPAKAAPPAP
ncbi:winged helix-turn-helix transcriptional regulator [Roseomonas sp. WA12]